MPPRERDSSFEPQIVKKHQRHLNRVEEIVVKIRDRQVTNQPAYAEIGVTLAGEKNILGPWTGAGTEGTKFRMSMLTDIKHPSLKDTFLLVCDGLKSLPEVVGHVWPPTTVQTCIIHLIHNTFQLPSKKNEDALKRDVKPTYSAASPNTTPAALDDLNEK